MSDATGYALHRPDILQWLKDGDAAIAKAMSAQPSKLFQAGEPLLVTGEPHDKVYRLRTGWLARTRPLPDGRKQIILVFLPTDLCGMKTMYLVRQPDAIEALGQATVDWIDYRAMRELVRSDSNVALRVSFQAMEDERRLHNMVVALGRGNAKERIAQMLLDFRGRLLHLNPKQGDRYRLPMTQQQIGDYLGLTMVHVNRVLRELRETEVVTMQKQNVTIHKLKELAQIATPMQDVFERTTARFGGSEKPI